MPGTAFWRPVARGAALTLALAIAARISSSEITSFVLEGRASPISPVLLGIVFGVLWRHFRGLTPSAEQGVQWILGTILHIGIALVGLRLTLSGLAGVGATAPLVVAACIMTAFGTSMVFGRLLGLSSVMQQLLAVGSGVCGCTAIVATSPAIRARPVESGVAVTCIVLIGSIGMLTYPWLASAVFHESTLPIGIFLGSAIHDTSQVVGASLIYAEQFSSPEVVGYASATKLFRNLSIVILVPLMAWVAQQPAQSVGSRDTARRRSLVPQFVIWFIVFVLVRALGDQFVPAGTAASQMWAHAMSAAQSVSDLCLTWGMTAVGLSISLTQMNQVGFRPICVAVIIAVATAACSLGMIHVLVY